MYRPTRTVLRCRTQEALRRLSPVACVLLVGLALAGCSSSIADRRNSSGLPTKASIGTTQQAEEESPKTTDAEQLQELWQNRFANLNSSAGSRGFLLGPGDVLRISVPLMEPLRDRVVLVSERDTISLPLIGDINLAGMSEEDLREELKRRLRRYMYHPEVEVFLKRSEDREVAVLGAVAKPGRYALTSKSDTLMTMIGRAGGFNRKAAARVILIPGSSMNGADDNRRLVAVDSPLRDAGTALAVSPIAMRETRVDRLPVASKELVINLTSKGNERYLGLPARPGDTLIIPSAGDVTVEGWVGKPGAYPITTGMTALSAIAAAGGAEFSSSATLVREGEDGRKVEFPLDLSGIRRGSEADIPVQSGDIVTVNRSLLGAIPYSLYFIANHTGFGLYPPML